MGLPSYVAFEPPEAAAQQVPSVSVIIPAYNEAGRVLAYIQQIQMYFEEINESYEVLVVDDGSQDPTANVVRGSMSRLPCVGLVTYPHNHGKGHAVRVGMFAARGALRLFADADGATPIAELARLREALREQDAEIAIGSRALRAPGIVRRVTPHRWVIGQVFRLLRSAFLKLPVADSQCGFKLFTARAAQMLFPVSRVDGFAFDVELLYLASRAGLKFVEVPVNWQESGSSRVHLFSDSFRMLRDVRAVQQLHKDTVFPR